MSAGKRFRDLVRPIARQVLYTGMAPKGIVRHAYAAAFHGGIYGREMYEWARRTFVATPSFLAYCESHGERISIDRVPYVFGSPRIQLGSDIRTSGQLVIIASWKREPLLKIDDGVYIGHDVSFALAERITVGRFASIGLGTHITDTEGHHHYNPDRPIWEVPAEVNETAPVTIEDGVQIGRQCTILRGVTIGARSVVGACSVIRSSVPPDSVVMGNPARVVKRLKVDT
jgi:acetyltransferase-like isoleucine patch superfamily enzyme